MKQKKISALMIAVVILISGCTGLSVEKNTPVGSVVPDGAPAGVTEPITPDEASQTKPETKPVTKPVTKPLSAEELLVNEWAEMIYPGIKISGFRLGGMTFQDAEEKLENGRQKALERVLSFRTDGWERSVTQEELGVWFDYETPLEEAKTAWKDLTAPEQVAMIQAQEDEIEELSFTAAMTIDEEKLDALAKNIARQVRRKATPSSYGRSLDVDAFKQVVEDAVAYSLKTPEALELPVEVQGLDLADEDRTTISKSYSWFNEGSKNRSFNVKRAAQSLDGVVVMPGEVFSFNDTVGSASERNGYKAATVYSGGGMASGFGGGVCQVSSTLYNAIINAGLPTVERHTHGYTVYYLPDGMDATIYYPSLDLKFRNNFAYPITIRVSAEDGDLSFRFQSHKDVMAGRSYEFSRKLVSENKPEWETIYTDDLKPGKESIIYYPQPGLEVDVYRTVYQDGEKVETEHFDNVSYRTLKGRKKVGEKKAAEKTEDNKQDPEDNDSSGDPSEESDGSDE